MKTKILKPIIESETKLLNIKETAIILGIAVGTLYHWKHEGKISCVKLGKALRFKKKDIEELINKNSHSGIGICRN
jgi:excisionase family DNA binding protein